MLKILCVNRYLLICTRYMSTSCLMFQMQSNWKDYMWIHVILLLSIQKQYAFSSVRRLQPVAGLCRLWYFRIAHLRLLLYVVAHVLFSPRLSADIWAAAGALSTSSNASSCSTVHRVPQIICCLQFCSSVYFFKKHFNDLLYLFLFKC